jgi:DNA-binding NarL/FixJ family response regulator
MSVSAAGMDCHGGERVRDEINGPEEVRLKVIIADSSTTILERLDSLLSEIPGIVVEGLAKDGEEAIALIRACEPEVVILDSSLPPEGGLNLLRELRKSDSPPVIIVITSFPAIQYRKRFHEAGAAYFFDKSREMDRLVEALVVLNRELVC